MRYSKSFNIADLLNPRGNTRGKVEAPCSRFREENKEVEFTERLSKLPKVA